MPYLEDANKAALVHTLAQTGGELNYLITLYLIETWKILGRYETIHQIRRAQIELEMLVPLLGCYNRYDVSMTDLSIYLLDIYHTEVNYDELDYIDFIAALRAAIDEFNRRITNDYEDKKIEQNGDVYQDLYIASGHGVKNNV